MDKFEYRNFFTANIVPRQGTLLVSGDGKMDGGAAWVSVAGHRAGASEDAPIQSAHKRRTMLADKKSCFIGSLSACDSRNANPDHAFSGVMENLKPKADVLSKNLSRLILLKKLNNRGFFSGSVIFKLYLERVDYLSSAI